MSILCVGWDQQLHIMGSKIEYPILPPSQNFTVKLSHLLQSFLSFTGEQRWHRLLHWDALHHAPPRLHLHHRLQVGDDEAHGRSHDGPLPCLRHHLPRPIRMLDHLPILSRPQQGNSFFVDYKTGLFLPQKPPSSPST